MRKAYWTSFIDLKKESVLLLFLPYLAYTLPKIWYSNLFSYWEFTGYLLLLLVIDGVYKKINTRRNLWAGIASIFFLTAIILFLYGNFIIAPIRDHLNKLFDFGIRGRNLFIVLFLLFAALQFFFLRRKDRFNLFLNRTMLLFAILIMISGLVGPGPKFARSLRPQSYSRLSPSSQDSARKPILLILLDEYHSPEDLAGPIGDSSVYAFSRWLEMRGWQTRKKFYSYEASTVHSLGSLYNFNLSGSASYTAMPALMALDLLDKASFADSLEKKHIRMVNFSFLNVGKNKLYAYLYPLPGSFSELFFYYSSLSLIRMGTNNLDFRAMDNGYYNTSSYNQDLIRKVPHFLDSATSKDQYVYVHFWMPHEPIKFSNEISLSEYNLKNYYQYWKFTNEKMIGFLDSVKQLNKYRVILTGDHGFRYDTTVDPHFTFAAFSGFDSVSISKLRCVQDLGRLINDYFCGTY